MSPTRGLAVACLAIVSFASLQAEPHCPARVAGLTMHRIQGDLFVVRVVINRTGPFDVLVDTGSQITTVDPLLVSELHLRIEGTTNVSGVRTQSRSAFTFLDSIEVGGHSVPHSPAIIEAIPELKAADHQIRGILGQDILSRFDVLIDNRHQLLCLDESKSLAKAIKGEHIPLVLPYGPRDSLLFARPMVVSARLTANGGSSVLLRLDSGSNTAMLYAAWPPLLNTSLNKLPKLNRVVNGVVQAFAVLPAQDILVGAFPVRRVPFVTPMNEVGKGPSPREDGVLPTAAFERVFISYSENYATLDPWPDR